MSELHGLSGFLDEGKEFLEDLEAKGADLIAKGSTTLADVGGIKVPSQDWSIKSIEELEKLAAAGNADAIAVLAARKAEMADKGVLVTDPQRIQAQRTNSLRQLISPLIAEAQGAMLAKQYAVAADVLGRKTHYSTQLGRQLVGVYHYLSLMETRGPIRVGGESTGVPQFKPGTIAELRATADAVAAQLVAAGVPVNTWGHAIPGVTGASGGGGSWADAVAPSGSKVGPGTSIPGPGGTLPQGGIPGDYLGTKKSQAAGFSPAVIAVLLVGAWFLFKK